MKLQNLTHILIGIVGIGLLPGAQAVVPPPDGGYPGFTTAQGTNALQSLTTGSANTAVGWYSLFSNAESSFNTATGAGSLLFNIADDNTAFGAAALLFNTTGFDNTAVGGAALLHNTSGMRNTASGASALFLNTEGDFNTATGYQALYNNTTGAISTANGAFALFANTSGMRNTAVGTSALQSNTEGNRNTAIGDLALGENTTGDNNTVLGHNAGYNVTTADNVICIGADLGGENVSNSCYIGNIFNVTSSSGSSVFIKANGKLGTITSSRRFKEQIKAMDQASEALFALKPVSFRYKKEIDPEGISQMGLVAEDVEKVNPDLVVRDKEGKPYSVRYDAVNAMLLNEFLKEHQIVQQQGATISRLEKQIEALTAGLQKVSAQVAAASPSGGGPAPQVVNNP
jgi:hypothetical protein